ncbi:hypothetical protein CcNV_003 [Crangon crangon nudivirus]|uniref:Uncharacterized protein n=1 Tax=Crangon crangon nudivirus TaxID=2880838 RepID=A0AAE8Y2A2_9VIRU|nr:hypothetical protein QKT25_gp003 [Crangon crangon nudivirus]UBZ25487.1 hypothetical protein CcNV_003 [Crangon crangon nudivirus]
MANVPTHDEQYIKYLQKSFGTTTVPFFGGVIVVITFILLIIIIMLNSTTVFVDPYTYNTQGVVQVKPDQFKHDIIPKAVVISTHH